jgi:hypothetical protein
MGFRAQLHSSNVELPMSGSGQKRTWRTQFAMSDLPPKANIAGKRFDVRYVPKNAQSALQQSMRGLRQVLPDFRQ